METTQLCLWKDRRRTIFGFPWSFTVYILESERLVVITGFLNKKYEEIQLYRISDISLRRSLRERLFRLGTITLCSSDTTSPRFEIKRIKDSKRINDLISRLKEEARLKYRGAGQVYVSGSLDNNGQAEQDGQDGQAE